MGDSQQGDFADYLAKTYNEASPEFKAELRKMLRDWCIEVDAFVKTPELRDAIRGLYRHLLELEKEAKKPIIQPKVVKTYEPMGALFPPV